MKRWPDKTPTERAALLARALRTPPRTSTPPAREVTYRRILEAVARFREGVPVHTIAEEIGVSIHTVYGYLRLPASYVRELGQKASA